MLPASGDQAASWRTGRPELDAIVGPVMDQAAELDELRTEIQRDLDRQRQRPIKPQLIDALKQASTAPGAPESLRRVARRVDAGELTWSHVVSGSSTDPDVSALTRNAQQAARTQFENADLSSLEQSQVASAKSSWIPRSWNDDADE